MPLQTVEITTTYETLPMTGSMRIKGRTCDILLVAKDNVLQATPITLSYDMTTFQDDLAFALNNAETATSPVEQEVRFLNRFLKLYLSALDAGNVPSIDDVIPDPDLPDNSLPAEEMRASSPIPPTIPENIKELDRQVTDSLDRMRQSNITHINVVPTFRDGTIIEPINVAKPIDSPESSKIEHQIEHRGMTEVELAQEGKMTELEGEEYNKRKVAEFLERRRQTGQIQDQAIQGQSSAIKETEDTVTETETRRTLDYETSDPK